MRLWKRMSTGVVSSWWRPDRELSIGRCRAIIAWSGGVVLVQGKGLADGRLGVRGSGQPRPVHARPAVAHRRPTGSPRCRLLEAHERRLRCRVDTSDTRRCHRCCHFPCDDVRPGLAPKEAVGAVDAVSACQRQPLWSLMRENVALWLGVALLRFVCDGQTSTVQLHESTAGHCA